MTMAIFGPVVGLELSLAWPLVVVGAAAAAEVPSFEAGVSVSFFPAGLEGALSSAKFLPRLLQGKQNTMVADMWCTVAEWQELRSE